jgi:hypothetical protein
MISEPPMATADYGMTTAGKVKKLHAINVTTVTTAKPGLGLLLYTFSLSIVPIVV